MRIYTDTMGPREIRSALTDAAPEAPHVFIDKFDTNLSARKRRIRHDVALYGEGPHHTRLRNPGSRDHSDNDRYAATWMDWGWFIAVMFRHEPTAIIGEYDGIENFHTKTAQRVRHLRTGARPDASVARFASRFPNTWPNHLDATSRDPIETESPFALVDQFCSPNLLINLNDQKVVSTWLKS